MNKLLKNPSAWIPVAFSVGMLTLLLEAALTGRLVPRADEGTQAHIFQLWLIIEVALIGYSIFKRFRREPKPALIVLVVQIMAVLAVLAPVYFLHL